jgi:CubicO group peptidase (beta-lactamase class C family)
VNHLDAKGSDPVALGWMVGSPPPPDRIVAFADDSFRLFPQTRWAFSHTRQLVPTTEVSRAAGAVSVLPRADRADIDAVAFRPLGRSDTMTWAESLEANYTDGIAVLHRGRIVYERYFGVLTPTRQHAAFSVTKSFVGTLAATLIAEGALEEHATVARYVPDLKDSGFGDATIRQLLDMTTGIRFSEDYADPEADVWAFARAGNLRPRPQGYRGPETFYAYLRTVAKEAPHGERVSYRTPNTDVLAWVIRRVSGKPLSELVGERIWSRLGAECDGYFTVDAAGTEFAGGGLNVCLRDLARFGELMRLGGRFNDQQIVPTAVVDDIRRGGDRDRFTTAGYEMLPGWSYRNMWWVSHNDHGAYTARGIHGQAIYVDPAAETVIARFASHPSAANASFDATSLPAYDALARHLMSTSR